MKGKIAFVDRINVRALAVLLLLFAVVAATASIINENNIRRLYEDSYTERVLITNALIASYIDSEDTAYYVDLLKNQDESFRQRQLAYYYDRTELYRLQEEGASEEQQRPILERLEAFYNEAAALKSDRYWSAIETLRHLQEISRSTYVYVIADIGLTTKDGEAMYTFIFDNSDDGVFVADIDALGISVVADDSDLESFRFIYEYKTQMDYVEYYSGEYGELYYAYAPILDKDGDVIAVIGTDLDLEDMYRAIASSSYRSIATFAVCLVIALLLAFALLSREITNPLRSMTETVFSLTERGVDASVSEKVLRKRGEIGVLASTLQEAIEESRRNVETQKQLAAAEAAREADRKREILLGSLEIMLLITDMESDEIIFLNEKMKNELSLDDDVTGRKCWSILHENAMSRCEFCPKNVADSYSNKPYVREFRGPTTGKDYRVKGIAIDWTDGRKVFLEQIDDITEVKAAIADKQRAIEEKDEFVNLSNILNGMDALIYVSDPDTDKLLFVSKSLMDVFGLDESCLGKSCYKVLMKDMDARCGFCPRNKLDRDTDEAYIWEVTNPITNRIYRCIDRYINWPGGKRVHLQHAVDITEFRTMTNALDKRLKQQSLMTFVSRSFIANKDLDTVLSDTLHMTGEFMGISQLLLYIVQDDERTLYCRSGWLDPVSGKDSRVGGTIVISDEMYEIFKTRNSRDRFYVTAEDQDAKKAMTPYRENFQNFLTTTIFIDGRLHALLDFSREGDALWSEDDINIAWFISNILTGVFQKLMMENELVYAKEIAERSSRHKSAFLANMSHEVRTPMNAILGTAEIELHKDNIPRETEEALSSIYESGNLLLNIINDILDLSKIEAGKLEIVPVRYDIASLINDSVQLSRLRYESKPIEFYLDVDENTPLNLFGDEMRIKQVLGNILSNAFKYTEQGEVKLEVWSEGCRGGRPDRPRATETVAPTEVSSPDDCVIIFRVSDTGQGMNEKQVSRLFGQYARFNLESNRTIMGAGLGLNITKQLLDLMGGKIEVQSEAGKGSVFTVRLPQKRTDDTVCGPALTEKLGSFRFRSENMSKKKSVIREYMPYGSVLVVDDVESNVFVTKGMLVPYGLSIDTVNSGLDAIEKVKSGKEYDIIFMDHMMPKMDGIEATRIIRDMGYTRSIVALTANALVGQAEVFLSSGFDGYISKPIDSRELNAALNEFIRDKKPLEVVNMARDQQRERELGDTLIEPDKNERSELEELFADDAKKAVGVIKGINMEDGSLSDEDLDEYRVAVHGMKSALSNIGENFLSGVAKDLELAASKREFNIMVQKTSMLVEALESLIKKYDRE